MNENIRKSVSTEIVINGDDELLCASECKHRDDEAYTVINLSYCRLFDVDLHSPRYGDYERCEKCLESVKKPSKV